MTSEVAYMKRMTRNLLLGLGGMALVAAGTLACTSLYFYHLSVRRNEKKFLRKSPDLPHMQKKGAASPADIPDGELPFHPGEAAVFSGGTSPSRSEDQEDGIWLDAQPTETWTISSEDGLTLVARWLPAGKDTPLIAVLAHGYSSRGRDMAAFARLFHVLGYHVLIPDARGHGDSGGDYIGFGWPDRLDLVQWTKTVLSRYGTSCRMVLFGISMGGATVMMASGEALPEQVHVIIEDCGYTSAHDQLAFQLKRMYNLPATPLIQATSLVTRHLAGYGFEEASALEQIKRNTRPTLFIHGTEDTFVPTSMVHTLYEACMAQKELYLVEGAGHGMAYATDRETYKASVSTFLDKHIHA